MDKYHKLNIKGKEIDLIFNGAFSYKFAQYLGVKDPTAANIGEALLKNLAEDALGTLKYLISAGIYGHEFVNNDGYQSKYKPSDIGKMLLEMDNEESEKLVNAVFKAFGFDLKAEVDEGDKKKVKKAMA